MNKVKLNRPVLAEGEVTGHAHVIEEVDVFLRDDGIREFDTSTTEIPEVRHEEHNPIVLPKKKFSSGQVKELGFDDMIKPVVD